MGQNFCAWKINLCGGSNRSNQREITYSIGETEKLTGASQKQIRYWIGRGYVSDVERNVCGDIAYRRLLVAQGHDRVLVGAYWHTGARKGEVLRWTWDEDINFEERWVRLGTRKNRSSEMTYEKLWINDDLLKLLQWQWERRN